MQLAKSTIAHILGGEVISIPTAHELDLPEKILQFGTGVLLRGLPDYFISKANRQGIFNGRIVVIKSTAGGEGAQFEVQDNLFTHVIKGIEHNAVQETYFINAAISRVLTAKDEWQQVMDCAANPLMQVVISNTTEVGIVLSETDKITDNPPSSFPGKLLAFLYKRYQLFNGSTESGMVIIPTELIVGNADKLKSILVQLSELNGLGDDFKHWLLHANDFCNSLVDRIVPGALSAADASVLQSQFGYNDALAIMSEPYSLWAIETKKESTRALLSFGKADKGVVITDNIYKYRELKLRLLNATHTFSCGLAHLLGFELVSHAMQDEAFREFVTALMMQEIVPCLVGDDITKEEAEEFANHVINRFSNPFIQHKWLSITLQYSGKIKSRCVPLIAKHYSTSSVAPVHMALGFVAYLLFTKPVFAEDNK